MKEFDLRIYKQFVHKQLIENNFNGDDDWYSFDDNVDINIWKDEYGHIKATAYLVVNGKTDTSIYKEIQ